MNSRLTQSQLVLWLACSVWLFAGCNNAPDNGSKTQVAEQSLERHHRTDTAHAARSFQEDHAQSEARAHRDGVRHDVEPPRVNPENSNGVAHRHDGVAHRHDNGDDDDNDDHHGDDGDDDDDHHGDDGDDDDHHGDDGDDDDDHHGDDGDDDDDGPFDDCTEHPESAACNSTWTILYQIASGHPLNDVWGLSEGDVGVVGWQSPLRPYEAVILNYDAFNWNVESGGPAATLEAITGNGLELLVVGSNGAVARRTTAGVWELMSTPTLETLRDIWAAPGTGSVAVGDNGTILELMGSIWSPVTSPTNANLNGIWGTGGTTIWGTGGTTIAVGENGTILMGVGGVFTAIPSPTNATLNGIWGTGGTTIWGTGGTTITVGDNGTVLNLVNGTFETVPTLSNINLQAIWGTGGTTIAVGEAGTILMNNGGGWTISQQSLTTETLTGVWGTSPTNIFVVGDQGTILHYGPVVP